MKPIKEHTVINNIKHKLCTKCNVQKPLEDYYKSSRTWDNLTSTCKECDSKKRNAKALTRIIKDDLEYKICKKCNQECLIECFDEHKGNIDGLKHICRKCEKENSTPSKKRIEHEIINGKEHKKCGKCETYLLLSEYNFDTNSWDKLRNTCKKCLQKNRAGNVEKTTEYNKQYWEKTKEIQKEKHKEWANNNKEHIQQKNKEYRELHGKEIDKKTYEKRKNDPEYREKYNEYKKQWCRNKRKNDVEYNIQYNMSRQCREILFSRKKPDPQIVIKYFGVSDIQLVKKHIEEQFKEDMKWDNYNKIWNIDHKIPCSAFNLIDPEEKSACFYYKNIQPMYITDNILKSDTYDENEKNEFIKMFENETKQKNAVAVN